jgi:uncharacterized membrane protein YhhN
MAVALFVVPILILIVVLPIRAEILKLKHQIYLFKPLATLLVIMVIVLSFREPSYSSIYSIGVLVGLILSFGGDMALMFPVNRLAFMLGLFLFLLAHIAYTTVFFSSWGAVRGGMRSRRLCLLVWVLVSID